MGTHNDTTIKEAVRDRYAGHAVTKTSCCGAGSCCGGSAATGATAVVPGSYDAADLEAHPGDADLGLGCGNPLALESLAEGETVVDLGSGGGIDCFLAARKVGPAGRVIGVDMTPEMIALARRNADRGGITNVEFRLGEIEALPVADKTADIVISNCVINLVPDKRRAFAETFRITRPGGRISVSDIVTSEPLPELARESVAAYVACLGGASTLEDYLGAIEEAGFSDVRVVSDAAYAMDDDEADALASSFRANLPGTLDADEARRVAKLFHSVTVQAQRP
ncbi:MAG: arsenite methyltransferase [Actinomycetota bacterium]|nr:arsenite methyltransferase [Actinomycetota bacterium]